MFDNEESHEKSSLKRRNSLRMRCTNKRDDEKVEISAD
jgi:hypothetical protein